MKQKKQMFLPYGPLPFRSFSGELEAPQSFESAHKNKSSWDMTVSWHEPFFMWSQFPDRGQTPFIIERKRSALRVHYCTENDTYIHFSFILPFSFYVPTLF